MARHFQDDNTSGRRTPQSRRADAESRAAQRARAAAEEREKKAWIAERMRQEEEAAAAEARERAAWIAERKRQERLEREARIREEKRAEEEARRREQEAKEAERRRKAEIRARKWARVLHGLKITALVLLALVVITSVSAVIVGYHISNSPTNLPNVYLKGIPVGGLTREETEQKLIEEGWNDPESLRLTVELPMELSFELNRRDAGLVTEIEDAVEAAYRYGHDGSMLQNVTKYFGARVSSVDLIGKKSLDHDYVRAAAEAAVEQFREKTAGDSYRIDTEKKELHFLKGAGDLDLDVDAICAAAEEALLGQETSIVYDKVEINLTVPDFDALYEELNVEPVDAHMDENFEVEEETVGCTFDVEEARKLWDAAEPLEELLIPLQILEPKVTAEELKSMLFRDCLGSQTTLYGGSTRARINNINLAVSKIDGVILMPGDTFSYNQTVGERTREAGFEAAPAYASGKVVEEVGGGVCQVSSTLYSASLYARMTTVSRTSHYFRVTYLPLGQDATVSWDEPDFKFRNDREYPVKIVAKCDNDAMELTIEIWGTDTDGIYVTLKYDQYAIHDTEYPDVVIGSNVYLWITYHAADGTVLETVEGSASTYFRHDYEIDWPPEKFQDKDEGGGDNGGGGGGGNGEVIIDDPGGGDDPGTGGGGGDDPGPGEVIIEEP